LVFWAHDRWGFLAMNFSAAGLGPFDAAAVLVVLAALLGYLNIRFFKLPVSVGMTVMGAVASLIVIAADAVLPGGRLARLLSDFVGGIDFHDTLMNGMLSFLLFAGALHVDWGEMHRSRWPILLFSTVGVVVSTALIGFGFYGLTVAMGVGLPLIWCCVFGALISPTDPVAVMGVLKRASVPPALQATVAGESLFNDGVGVVVFTILLGAAAGGESFSAGAALIDFLREAGGGVLLGLGTGYLAYRLMRGIDAYNVEIMLSLAVVMGGYSLAHVLAVSGPVAMAVAGLLIGNAAVADAMSETTRDYLTKFWSVVDDILNAVLFLLIGLEMAAILPDLSRLALGLAVIPLVMLARALSVGGPLVLFGRVLRFGPLAMPTLVWGGLRGGISVALALSLPLGAARPAILTATYITVLFAVIVQGGSIGWLVRRLSAVKISASHNSDKN
jgi:CPA1 family monovalent cation:H+ antiporter